MSASRRDNAACRDGGQVGPVIAYLGAQIFPNRRFAWGFVGRQGEAGGGTGGGDRAAFGWFESEALPRGVSISADVRPPCVLRRLPLTSEIERADLHLIPDENGVWCLAVEAVMETFTGNVATTSGARRNLEKQDILLHTIVHDLASPLSGIMGCLSAIEDGVRSPEELERLVGLALRQAHLQERLIRQILDVFRADNDELSEPEAPSPDLSAAARRVVESLEPSFARHGVELRLEDFCRSEVGVVGEETRLERVIANLLDNGLRHAPEGSAVIVRLEDRAEGVEVSVLDRGPGVPPERRGELFQKLRQGGNRGKLGLGLYFCRITVQRWGGFIGYAPRDEGPGARFWFRLPWASKVHV